MTNVVNTSRMDGVKQGRAEGLEAGRAEGAVQGARSLACHALVLVLA